MIIGITGTNGAGKGTVVDFLTTQKEFNHFSVRNFLIEEITRQGLPVDRIHMRQVANEMRKAHGSDYVVVQLVNQALLSKGNSVIESIRTIGEANFLRSHGALIWTVDADRKISYGRVLKRWSETDKVDFETFCMHEDREMNSVEPWDMNVFAVMQMANHTFLNNKTTAELYNQVEECLKTITNFPS